MDRRAFFQQTLQAYKATEKEYPLEKSVNKYQNERMPSGLTFDSYSINTYAGQWGAKQASHLLRRILFGFTKAELIQFSGLSLTDAVDSLLNNNQQAPAPPLNNYSNPNIQDPNIPLGQTWVNDVSNGGQASFSRLLSFKSWAVGQITNQTPTIREKMTLFWHNHFATESLIVGDARGVYKLDNYLRLNCLGNFKDMVIEVSKDPAMLVYLNGYRNTKVAPDENYARELFELFTLGKDEGMQYTENDVIAAARVLTGWRINPIEVSSFFQASAHDTDNKQFSSFFGNKQIIGKTGAAGANELTELIELVFERDLLIAKYLSRKIYRFFAHYAITTEIENNIISPMANAIIQNNWEVKPALALLFKSEHFYDNGHIGSQIKNPLDFIVGFGKLLDAQIPTELVAQYAGWNLINNFCASQGLNYGDPPSVSGWPAYYQTPKYHQFWINADTLSKRKQVVEAILLPDGLRIQGTSIKIDPIAFVKKLENPENPNLLIEECATLFYAYPPSEIQKEEMKKILLNGQEQDYYWTNAWNLYTANPTNNDYTLQVYIRLFLFFQYILSLPEYQLC